jgi:hypothetical protein
MIIDLMTLYLVATFVGTSFMGYHLYRLRRAHDALVHCCAILLRNQEAIEKVILEQKAVVAKFNR